MVSLSSLVLSHNAFTGFASVFSGWSYLPSLVFLDVVGLVSFEVACCALLFLVSL